MAIREGLTATGLFPKPQVPTFQATGENIALEGGGKEKQKEEKEMDIGRAICPYGVQQ